MAEKETSGATQSNSSISKASGAAPGGPFRHDKTQPTPAPVSQRGYTLQLLIALITKKPQ
jgi:hypothetical protein